MNQKKLLIILGILLLLAIFVQIVSGQPTDGTVENPIKRIQIQNEYDLMDGDQSLTQIYTFVLPEENLTCISTYHSWSVTCFKTETTQNE